MTDETIQGSQTEESQTDSKDTEIADALAAFGLETPKQEEQEQEVTPPAKEEEAPAQEEPKGIKVKFLKEERFIDETEIPDYVEKGLNHDRMKSKVSELQQNLDRAAKLQGFRDHADFIANLDTLEQQAQQREKDQYQQLRAELREQAEEVGLDPTKVEAWVDNHPLVLKAKKDAQEADEIKKQFTESQRMEEAVQKWNELLTAYPDLAAEKVEPGEKPSWLTPEMETLVGRGYEPIHAYELVYRDKIRANTVKQAEQKVIKEQMLGKRAQVETKPQGDIEPEVPENFKSAFEMFGIDPKKAKKYVKK